MKNKVKLPLPQRCPRETAEADWSAAIAVLDNLLTTLRAWQPTELPPSPPTEQDMVTLAALGVATPNLESDVRRHAYR